MLAATVSTVAAALAVCVAGAAVSAASVPRPEKVFYDLENAETLFEEFMVRHNKHYTSPEDLSQRFEIFKQSLQKVNELNSRYPDTVYTIYHFADLTPEELDGYRGFKPSNESAAERARLPTPARAPPAAFDWRDRGVVSHVKDQGDCGSCYIFSAIANIEGVYALKHNQCLALSEQQSLDCLNTLGCDGGKMEDVMQKLAQDKHGSLKAEDYPTYDATKHECREKSTMKGITVLGGKLLEPLDENSLKQTLVQYGPLSVGLNANDFILYQGGILSPNSCNGCKPNHGVLLVGYGEENGQKFWIIKNSWGEAWGEKGYVRLLISGDSCGVGSEVSVATVA